MIVLLLNCSTSWCQQIDSSSTGRVTIDIETVRQINEKLVEREYLLEEVAYLDTLANKYKLYAEAAERVILRQSDKIDRLEYNVEAATNSYLYDEKLLKRYRIITITESTLILVLIPLLF